MATIAIRRVPPYDGDYELDDRAFSTRELRWIKQISGYKPRTISEGFKDWDMDLVVALAVIAMYRAGKIDKDEAEAVVERFDDLPLEDGLIRLVADDEEEADAGPPSVITPAPEPSSPRSSPDSRMSSTPPSSDGSESSEPIPLGTGPTRSGTSPTSPEMRSVI